MRRNIELYIADRRVDLDDDSLVLFNYTQEDLSNPTIVKNTYSQAITLRPTRNNNKLFGEVFRMDRRTIFADNYTGAYFDVTRKTPFAIYADDGRILESGYCKLDEVTSEGNYSISLYGGLGSFLYGLMYDTNGNKLSLASLEYLNTGNSAGELTFTANKETLAQAWANIGASGKWGIVNFAPAYNGKMDAFKADKVLIDCDNSGIGIASSVIDDGTTYTAHNGMTLATLDREYGEWEMRDLRSYLQRPVISIKAIFDAISRSANNGGYSVLLDESFFNGANPYYYNAWMTLPLLPSQKYNQNIALSNDNGTFDTGFLDGTPTWRSFYLLSTSLAGMTATGVVKVDDLRVYMPQNCGSSFSYRYNQFDLVLAECRDGAENVVGQSTAICFKSSSTPSSSIQNAVAARLSAMGYSNVPVIYVDGVFEAESSGSNIYKWSGSEQTMNITSVQGAQVVNLRYYTGMGYDTQSYANPNPLNISLKWKAEGFTFTKNTIQSGATIHKETLLAGTATPADYLLSYCRMFGLILTCDAKEKVVSITSRNTYYRDETPIDLSQRIVRNPKPSIVPNTFSSRWLTYKQTATGEKADYYRSQYGIEYGCKRVNTGYEFNADEKNLFDSLAFSGAVQVLQQGIGYCDVYKGEELRKSWQRIGYTLRYGDGDNVFEKEVAPFAPTDYGYYNESVNFADSVDRPQFCDAEGKSTDGSGVLLFYNGNVPTPVSYYLSDDTSEMLYQNESTPCWLLSTALTIATQELPMFSRFYGSSQLIKTWDFELAKELFVPTFESSSNNCGIFSQYWKLYIDDRSDADTRVVTAKVDLRGLNVGNEALRHFYFFDGSVWVLNRIKDYNLASFEETECEFVKVNDILAYSQGISVADASFLSISPASLSASIPADGGTAVFVINSSTAWTLSVDEDNIGCTISKSSGELGMSRIEITCNTPNTSAVKRASFTITNEDTSKTINVIQAADEQPDTRTISFASTSASVARGANTFTTNINTSGDVPASDVLVQSNLVWCTISSVELTSANVLKVTYAVTANTGKERTAVLSANIIGKSDLTTFSVKQAQGEVTSFSYSPQDVTYVSGAAHIEYITIRATTNWTLSFYDSFAGLSLSQTSGGAGINNIELTFPRNTGSTERSCMLKIKHGSTTAYFGYTQGSASSSGYLTPTSATSFSLGAGSGESCTAAFSSSGYWSIESKPSWLNVSPTSGSGGNKSLTITTNSANNSENERTDFVVVALTADSDVKLKFAITQASAYIITNISQVSLGKNGSQVQVQVNASGAWSVGTPSASWLTATKASDTALNVSATTYSGTRTASVTLTLDAIPSITKTLTIEQSATGGVTPSISSGRTSLSFSGAGEDIVNTIYATGAWKVKSSPAWVSFAYSTKVGSTTGEDVTITAAANATGSNRTGTIVFCLVSDESVTASVSVAQSAEGAFTIEPESKSINYAEQDVNFTITANTKWKISNTSSMVDSVSDTSGTGNKTITAHIGTNAGTTSRTGTITFLYGENYESTKDVSISQSAAGVAVTPTSLEFVGAGESKNLTITSADGAWTATCPEWMSVSPASGNAGSNIALTATATRNGTALERTGSIVIALNGTNISSVVSVRQDLVGVVLSLSQSTFNVGYKQVTGSFNITCNTYWEIVNASEGLSFNIASGYGNASNGFTIPINAGSSQKTFTATIRTTDAENETIVTRTLTIKQGIATISVTPSTASLGDGEEQCTFAVTANGDWSITYPSWLVVKVKTDNSLTLQSQIQSAVSTRTANVVFKMNDTTIQTQVSVSQEGSDPIIQASVASQNVDYNETTGVVGIWSNTYWHLVSASEGLTFDTESGFGYVLNRWHIAENLSSAIKTYTARFETTTQESQSVAFTTYTIIQAENTATIEVSVQSLDFEEGSTQKTFTIRSTKQWTLASNRSWLSCEPSAGLANQTYTILATARVSLTDIQNAILTITSGISTKEITCRSYPPIEETTNEE